MKTPLIHQEVVRMEDDLEEVNLLPQQFREPGARAMPPLTEEGER